MFEQPTSLQARSHQFSLRAFCWGNRRMPRVSSFCRHTSNVSFIVIAEPVMLPSWKLPPSRYAVTSACAVIAPPVTEIIGQLGRFNTPAMFFARPEIATPVISAEHEPEMPGQFEPATSVLFAI